VISDDGLAVYPPNEDIGDFAVDYAKRLAIEAEDGWAQND
jgi:hypothetical protein